MNFKKKLPYYYLSSFSVSPSSSLHLKLSSLWFLYNCNPLKRPSNTVDRNQSQCVFFFFLLLFFFFVESARGNRWRVCWALRGYVPSLLIEHVSNSCLKKREFLFTVPILNPSGDSVECRQ